MVQGRLSQALSFIRSSPTSEGTMDKVTGNLSPLFGRDGAQVSDREGFLEMVRTSFDTGNFKDMGDTSRSGATFLWSGDYRFIAKTVRPGEYQAWGDGLLPSMGELLGLEKP